jgi:hypothetical protein
MLLRIYYKSEYSSILHLNKEWLKNRDTDVSSVLADISTNTYDSQVGKCFVVLRPDPTAGFVRASQTISKMSHNFLCRCWTWFCLVVRECRQTPHLHIVSER